jgi:hypothetical protein
MSDAQHEVFGINTNEGQVKDIYIGVLLVVLAFCEVCL